MSYSEPLRVHGHKHPVSSKWRESGREKSRVLRSSVPDFDDGACFLYFVPLLMPSLLAQWRISAAVVAGLMAVVAMTVMVGRGVEWCLEAGGKLGVVVRH